MREIKEIIEGILQNFELCADVDGDAPGRPAGLSPVEVPDAVIEVAVFGDFDREAVRNAYEIKTAKRLNKALAILRVDDRGVYYLPVLADESSDPYWRALNYRAACHYISAPDGSYKRPAGDSEEAARRVAASMSAKGMKRVYAGFEPKSIEEVVI